MYMLKGCVESLTTPTTIHSNALVHGDIQESGLQQHRHKTMDL